MAWGGWVSAGKASSTNAAWTAAILAGVLLVAPTAMADASWELTPHAHPSFAEDVLSMNQTYDGNETVTIEAGTCQVWAAQQAAELDLSFDEEGWSGTFLAEDGTANTGEDYPSDLSTGLPSATDEWPMFGLDAQHVGAPGSGPGGDGSEVWSFSDPSGSVWSSPAVVAGTVYVGSVDNNVYAIDADTGNEEWRFATNNDIHSSPAVVDGTVYIGSHDKTLYAIDADTGNEEWAFTGPASRVTSSPAVVDGTVYVGSEDGNLYAIDADTGSEEWRFGTGSDIRRSSPAVVDGTVYIGSLDGHLYAVDAATGDEEWKVATPDGKGIRHSSPAVHDGTVYVGTTDGYILARDATDGSEVWTREPTGNVRGSPAVVDGTVYIGIWSNEIWALDAATGTTIWSTDTLAGGSVFSTPSVAEGIVYVGANDDRLHALDATDGSVEWRTNLGNDVVSSPAVVGGTVYVGSDDNQVHALNAGGAQAFEALHTGSTTWSDDATEDVGSYASDAGTGTLDVPQGEHLAFEMCNPGPGDTLIDTSGDTLHAPSGSPSYPTPGLSALTLTIAGLALIALRRNMGP